MVGEGGDEDYTHENAPIPEAIVAVCREKSSYTSPWCPMVTGDYYHLANMAGRYHFMGIFNRLIQPLTLLHKSETPFFGLGLFSWLHIRSKFESIEGKKLHFEQELLGDE